MRIGIEAQRILRKKKHGMDMVALQLIKSLQTVAPENEYIVFVRPGDDAAVLNGLMNVKIVYVDAFTYADWEQIWLPLAILRHRIDLMHFTSNTASLFCPVPYVLTLHDVIFLENGEKSKVWYQRLGAIYRKLIVPIAARKAARVVTVSIFESGRILQYYPELESRVRVVYNAASSLFTRKNSIPSSLKLKDLPKEFFLFLGNTDPKKNTANVIRAYIYYRQYLKGELPLVIGDYPRSHVEKILVEEGEAYLLDDIISLGYLTQYELSELYKKATAFLYPSLRESFGIPILEAMASGCPVITANTSSMPEVAEDAAIIVQPERPEDISRALKKMERENEFRSGLISKGKKRASEFNWDKSSAQYVKLYEEVYMSKMLNKLSIQNL